MSNNQTLFDLKIKFCVKYVVFINVAYSCMDAEDLPIRSGAVTVLPTQHKAGESSRLKMSKRVLMTGFGNFKNVPDNLSWRGVDSMEREYIERTYEIIFLKEKIDVAYRKIDTFVPELWAKHQPDLTIHVGVNNISCIQLETQANRESYDTEDNEMFCPADKKHCVAGPDTVTTDLDVARLHDEFNALEPKLAGLTAQISNDAGKFICEYTYYTSLNCRGPSKTLFVHVPYKGFTEQEIAAGLERILGICLKLM